MGACEGRVVSEQFIRYIKPTLIGSLISSGRLNLVSLPRISTAPTDPCAVRVSCRVKPTVLRVAGFPTGNLQNCEL